MLKKNKQNCRNIPLLVTLCGIIYSITESAFSKKATCGFRGNYMIVILWNKENCKIKKNGKTINFINVKEEYRIGDILAEIEEEA